MDRDCEHCVHHTGGSCEVWECEFEAIEDDKDDLISRKKAIEAMTNTLWHYPNECYRNLNEYEFAKGLAELGLKSVPPSQPECERTETHACDLISRQAAIDFIDAGHLCNPNEPRWSDNEIVNFLKSRPSAQPEQKIISYTDCSNAMLKMWIDNVLTDGEYNRIMDKLNKHEIERRKDGSD